MADNGQVTVARLFEKTSASGNRYFFGRWGGAKVLLFHDARATEEGSGDAIWNLILQPAEESGRGQSSGRKPRQPRQPRQERRQHRGQQPPPADDWQAPPSYSAHGDNGDFRDDDLPEDMR